MSEPAEPATIAPNAARAIAIQTQDLGCAEVDPNAARKILPPWALGANNHVFTRSASQRMIRTGYPNIQRAR
jgi:hypothetical protein